MSCDSGRRFAGLSCEHHPPLVSQGACVKNVDSEGHTARSLAHHSNHMRTVTLLDSALDSGKAWSVRRGQ